MKSQKVFRHSAALMTSSANPVSAGKTEGRVERRGGARKPAKDRDPNDVQFINSLARGLQVLVAISDNPEGLGNSEIAQQVNLPNPTVSRITHTLTSQGYLLYAPRMGKYRLGPMVLAIWRGYMIGMKVAGVARPLMREFARQTRSIVTLGERCRLHIVYVEVQREFSTAVLEQEIGTQMPLAFSANGWAWLAGRLNRCGPASWRSWKPRSAPIGLDGPRQSRRRGGKSNVSVSARTSAIGSPKSMAHRLRSCRLMSKAFSPSPAADRPSPSTSPA